MKMIIYNTLLLGLRPNFYWKNLRCFHTSCKLHSTTTSSTISGVEDTIFNMTGSRIRIIFKQDDFQDVDYCINRLKDNLYKEGKYSYIVKIRYEDSDTSTGFSYMQAGMQGSIHYTSIEDIENMLSDIIDKIAQTLNDYNINSINIQYIEINVLELSKQLISDFSLNKDQIKSIRNHTDSSNVIFDTNIPISIDVNDLKPLKIEFKDNVITKIQSKNLRNKNFLDVIVSASILLPINSKNRITSFSKDWVFYDLPINSKHYILGVLTEDDKIIKIKFSKSGNILSRVTDILDKNNNIVKRITGNTTLHLNGDSKLRLESNINLTPLARVKKPTEYIYADKNIGSIDIEVYNTNDNIHKIYALGYTTSLDDGVVHTNYITDYDNSQSMVIEFIDKIMSPKYNNITFYCHNGGKYDFVYLIRAIIDYNNEYGKVYSISTIMRDQRILQLKIKNLTNKNKYVLIRDSIPILNESLSKLCKIYELDDVKGYFPHKFVSDNRLNYLGNKPSIDYYNDIERKDYELIRNDNWSLKDECLKYLNIDIKSLYEIIVKVNNQMFKDYNISITSRLTIAGLASSIFMDGYYNDNIPNINKPSIYNDIYKGYYGGITETYIPIGRNLYYYDVNSLYPYVALNDMPGVNDCTKITFMDQIGDIKDLFGFFYCEIETPENDYLGLLPVKNNKGLTFPLGKWCGWYFSEELKFAIENNYKVRVINGYNFTKQTNVFNKYVNTIYKIKSNPIDSIQKAVSKSILNNLLGRFGIGLYKPKTAIVDKETFQQIFSMKPVISHRELDNDTHLLTYKNYIDSQLISNNDLDLSKIISHYGSIKEVESYSLTSVVISAAITAYARIHMNKIKLSIINNGGKLYYSDTDSIITNIKLDDSLVDSKELGKLKLEHFISEGIFPMAKTYYLRLSDGSLIKRSKGLDSKEMNRKDYFKLLTDNELKKEKARNTSKIDWVDGKVYIDKRSMIFKPFDTNKRIRLFDKNSKWYDTKPIIHKSQMSYFTNNKKHFKKININYFKIIISLALLLISVLYIYTFILPIDLFSSELYEPIILNEDSCMKDEIINDKVVISTNDKPLNLLDYEYYDKSEFDSNQVVDEDEYSESESQLEEFEREFNAFYEGHDEFFDKKDQVERIAKRTQRNYNRDKISYEEYVTTIKSLEKTHDMLLKSNTHWSKRMNDLYTVIGRPHCFDIKK